MPQQNNKKSFHAFTIKYNGLANRITTKVDVFPAFNPAEYPGKSPYTPYSTIALWDTGATNSVITTDTVKTIGLIPTGQVLVSHAGGQELCNTYVINIMLPNKVGVSGVMVSESPNINGGFGAIIGMDIILNGDFAVTNFDGKTCMSYRCPSIQTIDYVTEANRVKFAGVGRNDPCPCGKKDTAGKYIKFKHCCGKSK